MGFTSTDIQAKCWIVHWVILFDYSVYIQSSNEVLNLDWNNLKVFFTISENTMNISIDLVCEKSFCYILNGIVLFQLLKFYVMNRMFEAFWIIDEILIFFLFYSSRDISIRNVLFLKYYCYPDLWNEYASV